MKPILLACAIHSFSFALFHMGFWRLFNWKRDLPKTTVSIRAIIQIANLRLIYIFLGVGALCLVFPEELVTTSLGRAFMGGMSLFWVGRLIEQFIFLRYNQAIIHVLSALFLLGTFLFAYPVFVTA